MDNQNNVQKVPWWVREEADSTTRLIGGLIIFGLIIIGLFVMELIVGDPKSPVYLKEAVVLTMLAYVAGWISGASGKRSPNGNFQAGGR